MRTAIRLAILVIAVLVEDGFTLLAVTGTFGLAQPPLTPPGPIAVDSFPAQDVPSAPGLVILGISALGERPQTRAQNPLIAPPASCRAADVSFGQGEAPTETSQSRSIVNGAQATAGSAVLLAWSALPGVISAWQRWHAGSKRLTGIVPDVYVPPG